MQIQDSFVQNDLPGFRFSFVKHFGDDSVMLHDIFLLTLYN